MRRLLLPLAALAAAASTAHAQVLASDDFQYAGPLTGHGWVAHSAAGTNPIQADGTRAVLVQGPGGEDVTLAFTPQTATDTTYYAFDLLIPSGGAVSPDANGLWFANLTTPSVTPYHAHVGVLSPAAGGGYRVGVSDYFSIGGGGVWPADLAFDVTYRIVASWDAVTAQATLWVDPVDMASPSVGFLGFMGTGHSISGVALRQSNEYFGTITVDNLMAGKSFADVLAWVDPPQGLAYCFGDGSGAACPCANVGGAGEGCANSSGAGATLAGHGGVSVTQDDLALSATGLLPGQPALLFAGLNRVNAGAGAIFGDGLRCAGGSVVRLGVRVPNAAGEATWGPGMQAQGGWTSGSTRRFQTWYRDPVNGPCGSAFNLSNGVEVVFQP